MAIHEFFQQNSFIQVHTPILTSSDCEGAGELFQVITGGVPCSKNDVSSTDPAPSTQWEKQKRDFFGCDVFLSVSGQLQAEIFASALSRVYTFGPTFRAENSNTGRHLAEFWMIEPEMAFADLDTNIHVAERCIKYVVSRVLNQCDEDLDFFRRWVDSGVKQRLSDTLSKPFARITYSEAIQILQQSGKQFTFPVDRWGVNLQSEHERYLCEQQFGNSPLFVTDYPREIKPFYAKRNESTSSDPRVKGETVAAVDLLVPRLGELIGGSVREHRYDVLRNAMIDKGMDLSCYSWYLDLRQFGSVPHAGWGMGFERFIQFLTGTENIRDAIPLPRAVGTCRF